MYNKDNKRWKETNKESDKRLDSTEYNGTGRMVGYCTIRAYRGDEKIFEETRKNIITNAGFDLWSAVLGNYSDTTLGLGFIAVGTGTSAFSAGSVALTAEYTRGSATYAHTGGTQTFTETRTFGTGTFATGGTTIGESGVFNQASSGTMFSATNFTTITLYSSDTLQVQWTYNLSGS